MHAITPRLFSKDVYSVPLRALHLRGGGGGVRLDRVGEWVVTKMFPDVQKIFRTYNNFSENTVFSKFTFSSPEKYLNSPANLLKFT